MDNFVGLEVFDLSFYLELFWITIYGLVKIIQFN